MRLVQLPIAVLPEVVAASRRIEFAATIRTRQRLEDSMTVGMIPLVDVTLGV